MKKVLRIIFIVGLFALLGWTIYFLYKKSETKPVVFNTQQPFITNIVKKTVATGAVVPRREINVKPQVSGIIEQLYVTAGDKVRKGDMIARVRIIPNMLNLANAESRINRAKLVLENSKKDYDRYAALFRDKMISPAEFQPYQHNYQTAREELESAENNLQLIREGVSKTAGTGTNTIVRSTIDGMVLDVPVKEGGSVIESNNFNEGTTIASVADMGEMIFEGKVDESEVGKIKPGMELILTIGAINEEKFKAQLEYIAPKGIKENGAIQFQIKAKMELKKDFFIRAGYSANADIVLAARDSVLAIPEALLQFEDEKTFVEIETAPQVYTRRFITTGLSDGINIEILSGLKADEKVKDPNPIQQDLKKE